MQFVFVHQSTETSCILLVWKSGNASVLSFSHLEHNHTGYDIHSRKYHFYSSYPDQRSELWFSLPWHHFMHFTDLISFPTLVTWSGIALNMEYYTVKFTEDIWIRTAGAIDSQYTYSSRF